MNETLEKPRRKTAFALLFPIVVLAATVAAEYAWGRMFLQYEDRGGPMGGMTGKLGQLVYAAAVFLTIGVSFVILVAGKVHAGTTAGLGLLYLAAAALSFFMV